MHVHVLGLDKLLICDILDLLFQWLTVNCAATFSYPIEKQSKCDSFDGSVIFKYFFFDYSAFFFFLHLFRMS